MNPPVVAIVGRSNVGKSTLFNALARKRISIVEPSSGVTRDRISTIITGEDGAQFELVDTGGMGAVDRDDLTDDVEEQISYAVANAAVLVFVVDGARGSLPQDSEIARRLRALAKPMVLVANKVESAKTAAIAGEFHNLGLGEPMLVSALHKINTGELRDRLFELAAAAGGSSRPPEMKVAIVGRRNVGKSTFINALAREKRVIVSELPGTTRDSVDVRFEIDGKLFIAIDTAGLRRKRQVRSSIEFYSRVRAEESVRRADVVLFMFDARSEVSRVDKTLARHICAWFKPCIIVVNKWDLVQGIPTGEFAGYFTSALPGLRHAPIAFVSALANRRVRSTIDLARSLWKQARLRVQTAELNSVIEELKRRPQRSARAARRPKIYYATQVGVAPPTLVLFVNSPANFGGTERRFVSKFLREHLPFHEVPIVVRYKKAAGRKT